MNAKTLFKWQGIAALAGIVIIVLLGREVWDLQARIEATQAQKPELKSSPGMPKPEPLLPGASPQEWDSWVLKDPADVARDFSDLQKRMDGVMDGMLPGHSIFSYHGVGLAAGSPSVSLSETDDAYKVVVTIPQGQQVELTTDLTDGVFRISGKVKNTAEKNANGLFGRYVSSSQFSQSLTLSEPTDAAAMTTERNQDEIVITIPKHTS